MEDWQVADYNFFQRYRDPVYSRFPAHASNPPPGYVPLSKAEIEKTWRTIPMPNYSTAPYPLDSLKITRRPFDEISPRNRVITGQEKMDELAFMNKPNAQLPKYMPFVQAGVDPIWKCTKILGKGGHGICALWETHLPNMDTRVLGKGRDRFKKVENPEVRRIVSKEAQRSTSGLRVEGEYMRLLNQAGSPHLTKMLGRPQKMNDILLQREGYPLDSPWKGLVKRLFLEYCEHGTLWDLLIRRIRIKKRFEEITLWNMFECLVDACTALEIGTEYEMSENKTTTIAKPNPSVTKWYPIVHFDLKPNNIFLADARKRPLEGLPTAPHDTTPIVKMGDFGSVVDFNLPLEVRSAREVDRFSEAQFRTNTTVSYLAPEQFTEAWDHLDYKCVNSPQDRIAGAYGPATNVFGIGIIMWHLAMLTLSRLDHRRPFVPPWKISGAPAKGYTYGTDMRALCEEFVDGEGVAGMYSASLISLIYECLYEKPALRPSSASLKHKIYHGREAAKQRDSMQIDTWQDMIPEEPVPSLKRTYDELEHDLGRPRKPQVIPPGHPSEVPGIRRRPDGRDPVRPRGLKFRFVGSGADPDKPAVLVPAETP